MVIMFIKTNGSLILEIVKENLGIAITPLYVAVENDTTLAGQVPMLICQFVPCISGGKD